MSPKPTPQRDEHVKTPWSPTIAIQRESGIVGPLVAGCYIGGGGGQPSDWFTTQYQSSAISMSMSGTTMTPPHLTVRESRCTWHVQGTWGIFSVLCVFQCILLCYKEGQQRTTFCRILLHSLCTTYCKLLMFSPNMLVVVHALHWSLVTLLLRTLLGLRT